MLRNKRPYDTCSHEVSSALWSTGHAYEIRPPISRTLYIYSLLTSFHGNCKVEIYQYETCCVTLRVLDRKDEETQQPIQGKFYNAHFLSTSDPHAPSQLSTKQTRNGLVLPCCSASSAGSRSSGRPLSPHTCWSTRTRDLIRASSVASASTRSLTWRSTPTSTPVSHFCIHGMGEKRRNTMWRDAATVSVPTGKKHGNW